MTNTQLTNLCMVKMYLLEAGAKLELGHATSEQHALSKALQATNKLIRDVEFELWSAT